MLYVQSRCVGLRRPGACEISQPDEALQTPLRPRCLTASMDTWKARAGGSASSGPVRSPHRNAYGRPFSKSEGAFTVGSSTSLFSFFDQAHGVGRASRCSRGFFIHSVDFVSWPGAEACLQPFLRETRLLVSAQQPQPEVVEAGACLCFDGCRLVPASAGLLTGLSLYRCLFSPGQFHRHAGSALQRASMACFFVWLPWPALPEAEIPEPGWAWACFGGPLKFSTRRCVAFCRCWSLQGAARRMSCRV